MLSDFSKYVAYDLFKLSEDTQLSGALEFFVYDTIKIFMLLAVIIFAISFIRSFFPPEKTRKILSHKKEFIGNILAALLGVVTPFCSCSELIGVETDCNSYIYKGKIYDSLPENMLREALYREVFGDYPATLSGD